MEPGGRAPAPGALGVIQAFINTRDVQAQREYLSTPEKLRTWLTRRELLDGHAAVGDADLRRAVELRESLRALLVAHHGGPVGADALATLNGIARDAPLVVQFDHAGETRLVPTASGVEGALNRILVMVWSAMVEGSWRRLKVCPADTCQWAFYDSSKNRSGTWCTMSICGNRAKVRAYQRRRRTPSEPPTAEA